ncbi:MAG: thrombospondin type 3 repeat-containing protein [Deltaproteobacteria bacterium]|nr:thrombospondin type 3 repeat-containing protein [Deltaproteobacteria bacterium]
MMLSRFGIAWFGAAVIAASFGMEQDASAQAAGECSSGFCGTPRDVGGGGCGCGGGSILINNTDMGETYSTSDDFDNDGFEDDFDNCPFVANRDQLDADNDGVGSSCDNAPAVTNPLQEDVDGDGLGDPADVDIDNDNKLNTEDNCPSVFNPLQKRTLDTAALGDACNDDDDADGLRDAVDPCPKLANVNDGNNALCDGDEDLDNFLDGSDNCPSIANGDQNDKDHDGMGDACDVDIDEDGILNHLDNAKLVSNPDQLDLDRDGRGDVDDADGLCYVFDRNKPGDCLNPLDTFKVGALAVAKAEGETLAVGDEVAFVLLANRIDTPIQYSWRVDKRPEGSEAIVANATGKVASSNRGFTTENGGFEYHYQSSGFEIPVLNLDAPGHWEVTLQAELVFADEAYGNDAARVATYRMALEVDGHSESAGGCATTQNTGLEALLVAALALFGLRRRRV